jgi:uncharacterized protein (DUF433 family)
MDTLGEFERMLPARSRGEKAQLLKWVVRELDGDFPGIDFRPDVCGGEPCIVRTRIPTLRAEDLANAWAYVRARQADIDAQIRENESA